MSGAKKPRPIINAMRKYGIENFLFEIIQDDIQTKEELDFLERYYITEVYHSLINEGGYNIERGGNGLGKHSAETRKKISESQLGKLNHMYGKTGSLNATSKKILELTTGNIYRSACEAAKALNLCFSHVCAVARGERGSTEGYVFRYIDENNNPIKPQNTANIKSIKTKNRILPQYLNLI